MDWVLKVLRQKGMSEENLIRIRRYYSNSVTIPVVNNNKLRRINNIRMTLRQGDGPSSTWFGYGINPLLYYLETRLQGIKLQALTQAGPKEKGNHRQLKKVEDKFILLGYIDDLKPAITKLEEFFIIEKAVELYERASGCKLHKDIRSKKCKLLPIG